jgi:hypothetical protein
LAICSAALQGNIKARVLAPPLCSVAISVSGSESFRFENNDQAGVKELDLGTHQIRDGLNHVQINLISLWNQKDRMEKGDFLGVDELILLEAVASPL